MATTVEEEEGLHKTILVYYIRETVIHVNDWYEFSNTKIDFQPVIQNVSI